MEEDSVRRLTLAAATAKLSERDQELIALRFGAELTAAQIAQILDQLKAEPTLSGTNIDARVEDDSVVLTGNVDTMAQHHLAVQIAQSNAGNRRIVDKIKVKQQT